MTSPSHSGLRNLHWWCAAASALAAVVAVAALELAPPLLGIEIDLSVAAGFGAIAGLLLLWPLRAEAELAAAALGQMSRGQPVAALPPGWHLRAGPLAAVLQQIDAAAARERELGDLRGDLLRQTGETAAQFERNRLARDLHDSIKQQLYAINVSSAAALVRWERDPDGARLAVQDVQHAAQAALSEMAALLRQLRPAPLAAAGLLDALREQCEAMAYRTGAEVTVDVGGADDSARYTAAVDNKLLAPGAEEAIFRIAQEALANVARHARATRVTLRLRVDGGALRLEIADNGKGFVAGAGEPGSASREHAAGEPAAGYGLAGMRDRAAGIGAALAIESAPGTGTRIQLDVPLVQRSSREEDSAMGAEVKSAERMAATMHGVALVAGGLAGIFILGLLPRLARNPASDSPWPLATTTALIVVAAAVAIVAAGRSRRSAMFLSLRLGAENTAALRLRHENAGRSLWLWLASVIFVPAALMPQAYPQYPMAAFFLGVLCVGLALLQIARLYRSTEGLWSALPPGGLAAELEQVWVRQRFTPLLVLAVTVPGYLYLNIGGPASPLMWPPSRNLVIDIMATLYALLLVVWAVVTYLQLRRWKARVEGSVAGSSRGE